MSTAYDFLVTGNSYTNSKVIKADERYQFAFDIGPGVEKKAFSMHHVDRIKFCPFIFRRPFRDEFILSKGLSRSQVLELKINISSFFFSF